MINKDIIIKKDNKNFKKDQIQEFDFDDFTESTQHEQIQTNDIFVNI